MFNDKASDWAHFRTEKPKKKRDVAHLNPRSTYRLWWTRSLGRKQFSFFFFFGELAVDIFAGAFSDGNRTVSLCSAWLPYFLSDFCYCWFLALVLRTVSYSLWPNRRAKLLDGAADGSFWDKSCACFSLFLLPVEHGTISYGFAYAHVSLVWKHVVITYIQAENYIDINWALSARVRTQCQSGCAVEQELERLMMDL